MSFRDIPLPFRANPLPTRELVLHHQNSGLPGAHSHQSITKHRRLENEHPTGQRRYSWKSEEIEIGEYQEGMLIPDVIDIKNNKLAWRRFKSP